MNISKLTPKVLWAMLLLAVAGSHAGLTEDVVNGAKLRGEAVCAAGKAAHEAYRSTVEGAAEAATKSVVEVAQPVLEAAPEVIAEVAQPAAETFAETAMNATVEAGTKTAPEVTTAITQPGRFAQAYAYATKYAADKGLTVENFRAFPSNHSYIFYGGIALATIGAVDVVIACARGKDTVTKRTVKFVAIPVTKFARLVGRNKAKIAGVTALAGAGYFAKDLITSHPWITAGTVVGLGAAAYAWKYGFSPKAAVNRSLASTKTVVSRIRGKSTPEAATQQQDVAQVQMTKVQLTCALLNAAQNKDASRKGELITAAQTFGSNVGNAVKNFFAAVDQVNHGTSRNLNAAACRANAVILG